MCIRVWYVKYTSKYERNDFKFIKILHSGHRWLCIRTHMQHVSQLIATPSEKIACAPPDMMYLLVEISESLAQSITLQPEEQCLKSPGIYATKLLTNYISPDIATFSDMLQMH